jgi:hypothetical protein
VVRNAVEVQMAKPKKNNNKRNINLTLREE